MASINEKLNYINETKSLIKDKLDDLGSEIDNETTFREYAEKIENLYEEWPKISDEDTTINLENTKKGKMNLQLKGNTSQNGTPTPSSPIGVNVVSGDNTIDIYGKNLLGSTFEQMKEWNTSGTWSGNKFTKNGIDITPVFINGVLDRIELNGTCTGNLTFVVARYTRSEFLNKITIGSSYTLSGCPSGGTNVTYYLRLHELPWKNLMTDIGNSFTITMPSISENVQSISMVIGIDSGTNVSGKVFKPMFRLSNINDTYEPYINKSYPIYLGDIELCKIETYQDYIYKDNGVWYLHKEIGKVVLNGTEGGGTIYDNGQRFGYTSNNVTEIANVLINTASSVSNLTPSYSNRFTSSAQNGVTPTSNTIGFSQWGTTKYIYLSAIESTVADYKTWLSNNNVEVYFPLATPTNTLIEDTTLTDQLEEIYKTKSKENQTNINQKNNNLPFIINATALMKNSD